jgi:hypothetical protein
VHIKSHNSGFLVDKVYIYVIILNMSRETRTVFNFEHAQQLFEKSGRTTAWVAEKIGISIPYLNMVLNGTRTPSLPVIKLLASLIECREQDLLSEDAAS